MAVNDTGQIVGIGLNVATYKSFIGASSGTPPIPPPLGAKVAMVVGQSINNAGVVVAESDVGGWIWDVTNGTRLLNCALKVERNQRRQHQPQRANPSAGVLSRWRFAICRFDSGAEWREALPD